MSNIQKPKSVLTVDHRDKQYGVCRRSKTGTNEPGFVVYRGNVNAEVRAHFFDQSEAEEYAKFKNQVQNSKHQKQNTK